MQGRAHQFVQTRVWVAHTPRRRVFLGRNGSSGAPVSLVVCRGVISHRPSRIWPGRSSVASPLGSPSRYDRGGALCGKHKPRAAAGKSRCMRHRPSRVVGLENTRGRRQPGRISRGPQTHGHRRHEGSLAPLPGVSRPATVGSRRGVVRAAKVRSGAAIADAGLSTDDRRSCRSRPVLLGDQAPDRTSSRGSRKRRGRHRIDGTAPVRAHIGDRASFAGAMR